MVRAGAKIAMVERIPDISVLGFSQAVGKK
jgi:hypothetical protein